MAAILSRPQCVNQVSLKFAAAEGMIENTSLVPIRYLNLHMLSP